MIPTVYADNAATTRIADRVLEAMLPFLKESYGNPSSIYKLAEISWDAVAKAREQVADVIGAKKNEIFFTGGGSESDNWAIKGAAYANRDKGNHIITTKFEHHAVLHTTEYLEENGFEVTYLDVGENGIVSLAELEAAIKPETILITVMAANNEIGTIQPIAEIGEIAKRHGIIFHTDAVQAIGNMKVNVHDMNIDLLSLSAHKLHGPKGVGALYIRKGVKLDNLIHGGAQESGRRAGTENVAGIVGLGEAITAVSENMEEKNARVLAMRERLIDGILKIPYTRLNGDRDRRLPGNCNISIKYIEGESLILMLSARGIASSSGSACTSGSLDPSHVLLSIGLTHEFAHGSLRLTLGDMNTEQDVDYILEVLPEIVTKLRMMSPLYDEILKDSE